MSDGETELLITINCVWGGGGGEREFMFLIVFSEVFPSLAPVVGINDNFVNQERQRENC